MAALNSRFDTLFDALLDRLGAQARVFGLRPHVFIALLAALLAAPSLAGGLVLDDHVLALGAGAPQRRGEIAGLHVEPLSLFRFTTGKAEDNRALMDGAALLPWWSDEHHRNAFFRPLSSLSHVLDFRLWPGAPWLMHAHSVLWLVALVLALAHVVSRIEGGMTAAALLGVLLFAIDGAHGMTVAWLANRNALIAATLALPAIGAHHRWLTQRFALGALLGPLCFALGLCAGETAIAVLGYVLAYTLVLDRAPIAKRVLHLAPYLALLIAWQLVFRALGLGSAGSAAYHDPIREPFAYAAALCVHLPILLGSQLGVPIADLWFWGPPAAQWLLLGVAIGTVLLVLGLAHVLLRRDSIARFWMIGMVLSACAVAASVPGERLLLVPSIGGAALLARLVIGLRDALREADWTLPMPRGAAQLALGALLFIHGPMSIGDLQVRIGLMSVLERAVARADAGVPRDASIERKQVVIINPPVDMIVSYLQIARATQGASRPAHLNWLATASSALTVTRIDARTLRVAPEQGFIYTPYERHYRADSSALTVGKTLTLSAFSARISARTDDGRPAAVDFTLTEPMDSTALVLKQFRDGALVDFSAPAIGERVVLPAATYLGTLAQAALR